MKLKRALTDRSTGTNGVRTLETWLGFAATSVSRVFLRLRRFAAFVISKRSKRLINTQQA